MIEYRHMTIEAVNVLVAAAKTLGDPKGVIFLAEPEGFLEDLQKKGLAGLNLTLESAEIDSLIAAASTSRTVEEFARKFTGSL